MNDQRYTWTSFYSELSDKLLLFKDDRRLLIEKLQKLYEGIGISFPKLDSDPVPADIDPYTVFGLFNKGISEVNRKSIIAGIAEAFDIEAGQPTDFDGIPVMNNLNATFYAFSNDSRRGESDIDNLWRVFVAELALADNDNESTRAEFVSAFETAIVQFGIGWKLTMGLLLSSYRVLTVSIEPFRMRCSYWLGRYVGMCPGAYSDPAKETDSLPHSGRFAD